VERSCRGWQRTTLHPGGALPIALVDTDQAAAKNTGLGTPHRHLCSEVTFFIARRGRFFAAEQLFHSTLPAVAPACNAADVPLENELPYDGAKGPP
jgi:hypothetical protein